MSQTLNPHNFVQPLCYFPCISQHRTGIIFFKAAKGYHSRAVLKALDDSLWKTRIAEPKQKGFSR